MWCVVKYVLCSLLKQNTVNVLISTVICAMVILQYFIHTINQWLSIYMYLFVNFHKRSINDCAFTLIPVLLLGCNILWWLCNVFCLFCRNVQSDSYTLNSSYRFRRDTFDLLPHIEEAQGWLPRLLLLSVVNNRSWYLSQLTWCGRKGIQEWFLS